MAAMLEEETKKRRPCWRTEIFFWGLNSIFMQILPFASLCKYGFWSHERTHSIVPYLFKGYRQTIDPVNLPPPRRLAKKPNKQTKNNNNLTARMECR